MATVRGGAKAAKVLERIAVAAKKAQRVRVGFMADATYPDGTSVAMVAAIQDFGAPRAGIPPRPFFRNMIAAKSKDWPEAAGALLIRNNYDAERTLVQMGKVIAGQLRLSIHDTNAPPLKPATIRGKGFAKPLIDEAIMINSVSSEVE